MDTKKIFVIFLCITGAFVVLWFLKDVSLRTPSPKELVKNTVEERGGNEGQPYTLAPTPEAKRENLTEKVIANSSKDFYLQLVAGEATTSKELLIDKIKNGEFKDIASISKFLTPDQIGFVTSTQESILVQDPASSVDINVYKNSYGELINQIDTGDFAKNSTTILNDVIKNNNTQRLDDTIKEYYSIYNALLKVKTPRIYVEFHKQVLVALKNIIVFLESMRSYKEDPIRAYIAAEYYASLGASWDAIHAKQIEIFKQ